MTDRLTRIATPPHAALRPLRNTLIGLAGRLPQVRRAIATRLAGYG